MVRFFLYFFTFLWIVPANCLLNAQTRISACSENVSKKAIKLYEQAADRYVHKGYSDAIKLAKNALEIEPEFADACFLLGMIYTDEARRSIKTAKEYFLKVADYCPDYNPYVYFFLAEIYYGDENYGQAFECINKFLADPERIDSDGDYAKAMDIQKYAGFIDKALKNPVPFNPLPVKGISTAADEYLPIISPDDELALFTRRISMPASKNDLIPKQEMKERFMFSKRLNGSFEAGQEMPFPFNRYDNEGGATLTIDNRRLYYTVCKFEGQNTYFNCDICTSEFRDGIWETIENLGDKVNLPNSWESQPSVTSDGNTLFFISDRPGGLGGYDIYSCARDASGNWQDPVNLGPTINTPDNEKSPFIHTDSQTLYFSSQGHLGLGGYDIFYSRLKQDGSWSDPVNIGYPINSFEDDVGFFVSTDGHYGYFASNKLNGSGGWDLYSFDLYEEARPEKVLFVKGNVVEEQNKDPKNIIVELKNIETRKITQIPVDTITGDYAFAVVFRNDYILTAKKKGYAYESRYFSKIDNSLSRLAKISLKLKTIEVGKSYKLNDIYFDFNSYELKDESMIVIDEFSKFLVDNPEIRVAIHGHTDNIGQDEDNNELSERRAQAVYDYLVRIGIQADRLQYKGFGESVPVATNETAEGRALNRRTEFVILKK